MLAGNDHDPVLVGHHHVAGSDRDVADPDRLTGRFLPQATTGGHWYLSPREDREAELPGLVYVPAGAVRDDAPDRAHGGADAHDPTPGGHGSAAAVGDHDDVVGPGPGDRFGEDVGAAVLRVRLAAQRFELDGHREPGHLGAAPHRPQPALARRKPAGIQGVRHGSRLQGRELRQQGSSSTHALQ